jgi:hypothetical protein
MRCTVQACAWPAAKGGVCVFHLRDLDLVSSRDFLAMPFDQVKPDLVEATEILIEAGDLGKNDPAVGHVSARAQHHWRDGRV